MNKIKILPPQEALKIAAGEVVERPASIVKETIENSIDAKATQITLYINKAGQDLIRIQDNGHGMSKDDAKICFAVHATSKIKSLDDLENINSFGFRGEALATISAVSKVTLVTKEETSNLGTKLEYSNGKFTTEEEVACSVGTDLIIKDLFYNTPVRKKFLKQDETEWNQISNIFHAFCLSNLDIHFKLYRDDRLILNAPAVVSIKDRASQIWGHNFAQNLIVLRDQVEQDKEKVKVTGFISNHNFWRYGRQQIFFFANNRAIKNKELSKALLKGYQNVLPPARFPAAFLFLDLKNSLVDINVHPRKEEVKFAKPATIELMLQKLVTQSLGDHLSRQLETKQTFTPEPSQPNFPDKSLQEIPEPIKQTFTPLEPLEYAEKQEVPITQVTSSFQNLPYNKNNFQTPSHLQENTNINTQEHFKIIGQYLNTYILIEREDKLVIIDQHAAHERILYEKFSKNFEKKAGTRLLFPEILNLSDQELQIILKEKEFFANQGIELEQFGQNQIAIKTSPPKIQNQSLKELVFETIEFVQENEHLEKDLFRKKLNDHMHTHMACKAAIKAGDKLTLEQMNQVIKDLLNTNNRFICAHGRPTTWNIDQLELEKKFRRK